MEGKKSNIQYVKVFGCVAYIKRLANQLTKLNNKSVAMVYLGVEPGNKVYWLFNPKKNKLHVACDVIFYENAKWN